MLIDWPISIIYSVQNLAKNSFPFNLVWIYGQASEFELKSDNGVVEMKTEASSSLFLDSRLQSLVDEESGHDTKGKKIINQKQRTGIRRRRRAVLGYEKSPSVSMADSKRSAFASVSSSPHNGYEVRGEISESLDTLSRIEDGLPENRSTTNGLDPSEKTWHGIKSGASFGESENMGEDSASVEKIIWSSQDEPGILGNGVHKIRTLEKALEEEKTARAALYLELEKERASSATAADEAMAMILRLQEEKASIEMEARQYQRMIEEKFVYDEEEMRILKDMLVSREKEIHFLEKEIESYRQMELLRNEQSEVDFSNAIDNSPRLAQPSRFNPHEHDLPEKTIILAGKEKAEKDDDIVVQGLISEAVQTCSGFDKNCSCGGEEQEKDEEEYEDEKLRNLHSSITDTEPTVYDVYVVDDKTELRKEERRKEGGPSNVAASGFAVWRDEVFSDCQSTGKVETEPYIHTKSLGMSSWLPMLGNSQLKPLLTDVGRNASSAVINCEKLKIDTEVEWLRQRLRIVQEQKEKLTFSAEHGGWVKTQLKLMEDMVNQLQQIQQMREQPPSSSKVSLKKRRCQSVPSDANGSI
ncbi:Zein-binding domain-containing protein [Cephalotus follicularis]|uniref:Zein-binding domain-containing protein n=1 Tax=Cephalotus follicularis TaxID=3775 RepID=A0A1Q3BRS4_CEPFO|nr:Zein-binding domain-containing protein [Cephalotus follicularis]